MKDEMSHNTGLITNIVRKVERHKGKLTIALNSVGTSYDVIKGGGYHKQGGIVFDNEEIALDLLNTLQEYFDKNKITIRKEVYGWLYSKVRAIKLHIWCWYKFKKRN